MNYNITLPKNDSTLSVYDDSNSIPITSSVSFSPTIQGESVTVFVKMNTSEITQGKNVDFETFIKEKLVELLAKEIAEKKLCEFTKEYIASEDTNIFRARAFLTPNDQVKLLREKGFIK